MTDTEWEIGTGAIQDLQHRLAGLGFDFPEYIELLEEELRFCKDNYEVCDAAHVEAMEQPVVEHSACGTS